MLLEYGVPSDGLLPRKASGSMAVTTNKGAPGLRFPIDPERPLGLSPVLVAGLIWAAVFMVVLSLRLTDKIHGNSWPSMKRRGIDG